MFVRRNIRWSTIFIFSWARVVKFSIWGIIVVWLFHYFDHMDVHLGIPFLPISTIGIAVSFYLGFKNNSAYDRFWEARKIWGGIINYSRTWANQVLSLISEEDCRTESERQEARMHQKSLIKRHLAWINALRLNLRKPTSFSIPLSPQAIKLIGGLPTRENWDNEVQPFIGKREYDHLMKYANVPTQLIREQGRELKQVYADKRYINDFQHVEMMRVLEEFYNLQGKCERIKKTPFPRQYAHLSKIFAWMFVLLMPFGLVPEFAKLGHHHVWLSVPVYVLISWIFITIESVGDGSEDPFENQVNDVPMTALCRVIEIDLLEMLGEKDIPAPVRPINDILL